MRGAVHHRSKPPRIPEFRNGRVILDSIRSPALSRFASRARITLSQPSWRTMTSLTSNTCRSTTSLRITSCSAPWLKTTSGRQPVGANECGKAVYATYRLRTRQRRSMIAMMQRLLRNVMKPVLHEDGTGTVTISKVATSISTEPSHSGSMSINWNT